MRPHDGHLAIRPTAPLPHDRYGPSVPGLGLKPTVIPFAPLSDGLVAPALSARQFRG